MGASSLFENTCQEIRQTVTMSECLCVCVCVLMCSDMKTLSSSQDCYTKQS